MPIPSASPSRRATIGDVARLAGVSPTTVSLVVNGQDPKISEATRIRVRAAVEELGYRPNKTAQSLRSGQTHTIGVLTDEIATHPFSGGIIAAIHDLAWERGSSILMVNTTRNVARIKAAVDDMVDRRVDSLIYAAIGTRESEPLQPEQRLPIVLVNCYSPDDAHPSILPDEEGGGRSAIEHVLAMGHERIAYITGRPAAWATKARLRGFRRGLEAAGRSVDESLILTGNFRIDSGYELTMQIMSSRPHPTALLCGNDQMAIGAYLALARLGLRVPEDVSVVGYDDEFSAADLRPALTTIRIPFYEMGKLAVSAVLGHTVNKLPPTTYVPCPIIERASAAPI